MTGKFLLNDHSISYLIHGQPLKLEYQTEDCWFVIISYNNGGSFFKRIFFKKANGVFNSVTNVYSPEIKLWGVKWGMKKLFHHHFHINFLNAKTQVAKLHTPDLPGMPEVKIKLFKSGIKFSSLNSLRHKEARFINNSLYIKPYDDFEGFKQNNPSSQTIK